MNKFRRTSFEVAANFSMTSNQKIKFTFCIFDFFCCQQLEIPNKKSKCATCTSAYGGHGSGGKLADIVYNVYEQPVCKNPTTDSSITRKPPMGNGTQLNKDKQSKYR